MIKRSFSGRGNLPWRRGWGVHRSVSWNHSSGVRSLRSGAAKANSDTETKPSENNLTVFVDALCSGPVLFQDSFLIPFQCVQPMLNVLQGCADRCAEAERQRRARAFFLQLSWLWQLNSWAKLHSLTFIWSLDMDINQSKCQWGDKFILYFLQRLQSFQHCVTLSKS